MPTSSKKEESRLWEYVARCLGGHVAFSNDADGKRGQRFATLRRWLPIFTIVSLVLCIVTVQFNDLLGIAFFLTTMVCIAAYLILWVLV